MESTVAPWRGRAPSVEADPQARGPLAGVAVWRTHDDRRHFARGCVRRIARRTRGRRGSGERHLGDEDLGVPRSASTAKARAPSRTEMYVSPSSRAALAKSDRGCHVGIDDERIARHGVSIARADRAGQFEHGSGFVHVRIATPGTVRSYPEVEIRVCPSPACRCAMCPCAPRLPTSDTRRPARREVSAMARPCSPAGHARPAPRPLLPYRSPRCLRRHHGREHGGRSGPRDSELPDGGYITPAPRRGVCTPAGSSHLPRPANPCLHQATGRATPPAPGPSSGSAARASPRQTSPADRRPARPAPTAPTPRPGIAPPNTSPIPDSYSCSPSPIPVPRGAHLHLHRGDAPAGDSCSRK